MQLAAFKLFAQQYLAALLEESGQVHLNQMIPRDPRLRTYKYPSRTNFGTGFLSALVGSSSAIMISPEVMGEAKLVDVLFEPKECRDGRDRCALGCLQQFLHAPTLIQVLRHAPNEWEMQGCLHHWLRWQAEMSGDLLPQNASPRSLDELDQEPLDEFEQDGDDAAAEIAWEAEPEQQMLILVPSVAVKLLHGFGIEPGDNDLGGIYHFPPAFKITVVVISQLPLQPSTLLLRLLGRGPVQRQAIEEIAVSNHPLRDRAIRELKAWCQLLQSGQVGRESQQLMKTLIQLS